MDFIVARNKLVSRYLMKVVNEGTRMYEIERLMWAEREGLQWSTWK